MTQNANATAQVVAPPTPGSPEYDAAMIAVAERGSAEFRINAPGVPVGPSEVVQLAQTPEQKAAAEAAVIAAAAAAKPQRPANVPEKFWNAETGVVNTEALLKSYSELEQDKSKRPPAVKVAPVAPVKSAEQTAAEVAVVAAKAAMEASAGNASISEAAKAGMKAALDAAQTQLDTANTAATAAAAAADATAKAAAQSATLTDTVAAASAEYAEKGEMSDATYTALEAQGLSRDYVDAYVDGLKARSEVVTAKVYDAAGGEANYATIKEWAAANLSEQEIAAANAAIHSGNLDAVIGQVKSLKATYEAANGTEGVRIEGKGGAASVSSGNPFQTKSEVTAAMSDPKYKNDASYRLQVEKRIEASMKANIDLGF